MNLYINKSILEPKYIEKLYKSNISLIKTVEKNR